MSKHVVLFADENLMHHPPIGESVQRTRVAKEIFTLLWEQLSQRTYRDTFCDAISNMFCILSCGVIPPALLYTKEHADDDDDDSMDITTTSEGKAIPDLCELLKIFSKYQLENMKPPPVLEREARGAINGVNDFMVGFPSADLRVSRIVSTNAPKYPDGKLIRIMTVIHGGDKWVIEIHSNRIHYKWRQYNGADQPEGPLKALMCIIYNENWAKWTASIRRWIRFQPLDRLWIRLAIAEVMHLIPASASLGDNHREVRLHELYTFLMEYLVQKHVVDIVRPLRINLAKTAYFTLNRIMAPPHRNHNPKYGADVANVFAMLSCGIIPPKLLTADKDDLTFEGLVDTFGKHTLTFDQTLDSVHSRSYGSFMMASDRYDSKEVVLRFRNWNALWNVNIQWGKREWVVDLFKNYISYKDETAGYKAKPERAKNVFDAEGLARCFSWWRVWTQRVQCSPEAQPIADGTRRLYAAQTMFLVWQRCCGEKVRSCDVHGLIDALQQYVLGGYRQAWYMRPMAIP